MINIKKIRPMFTTIVTTMDKYEKDELTASGLVDVDKLAGTIKEYQKVIAVGSMVRDINPGDLVCIDASHYEVKKFHENSIKSDMMENQKVGYRFNVIELDGIPHLLLTNQDILYVIEEYEDVTTSNIYIPGTELIL